MKAEKTNRLLDYLIFMQPQWSRQLPIEDVLETKEELSELERLSKIGRYTEMAFQQGGFIEIDVLIDPNDDESAQTCILDTKNRLVVWGKKQEGGNA